MKKIFFVLMAFVLTLSGCEGMLSDDIPTKGKASLTSDDLPLVNADGSVTIYSDGLLIPDLEQARGEDAVQYWDYLETGKHIYLNSTAIKGHTGKRTILIDNEVNPWRALVVFLENGVPVFNKSHLSLWAKVSTSTPAQVLVYFGAGMVPSAWGWPDAEKDKLQMGKDTFTIQPGDDWQEFKVYIKPAAGVYFDRIKYVVFSVGDNQGKVHIDDVKFMPVPPAN